MSGQNRGRYIVAFGGPWRLYTHPLPGWQMLGTIQRGMEIGALGESPAALLAQINAGAVRSLEQRKAHAALTAARKEQPMTSMTVGLTIPDDVDFSQLKLARDPDGAVSFDWTPIERICRANGVDPALFRNAPEDNVSALIVAWYRMHLDAGGAIDPVQADLIAEAELEDRHGGGLSHQPGRA
ncbi:MAG: hypothetical protein JF606_25755 [Burkholderiales bacterium]|nr:hypothetical protein [Burkholderiales bacterium]